MRIIDAAKKIKHSFNLGLKGFKAGFSKQAAMDLKNHFARMLGIQAAPERGDRELLKAYNTSPNLRAVVNKVSYSVASTEWKIYKKVDENGRATRDKSLARAKGKYRKKSINKAIRDGDLEEIVDHPFLDVISNLNDYMTGLQSMKLTDIWFDLLGDAYWIIERNEAGMPVQLYPIPRIWITETPQSSGGENYRITMPNGSNFTVPRENVVPFIDPDPTDPYSGFGSGFGRSLADEIDTDENAAKHTKNYFYNDATPPFVVSGNGMEKSQAKRFQEEWLSELQGRDKKHKPRFVNADIDITELGSSFKDNQMIELRKFERDIVKSVYGVPPEAMGIVENSNRATIEAAETIMAKFVTIPRLELIRSTIQAKLLPEYDDKIILDYVSPLPEDKEYKKEIMKNHSWAFEGNEFREAAGLQPKEGLDSTGPRPIKTEQEKPEQKFKKKYEKQEGILKEMNVESIIKNIDEEQLTEETKEVYSTILSKIGQETIDMLPGGIDDFDTFDTQVARENYIMNQVGDNIVGINDTTKQQIRQTLLEGVREGEGIGSLQQRVSETFSQIKDVRANTIARTETMDATNFSTLEGYKKSGVVEKKEWIATQDGRVRDSHAATDGQVVGVESYFTLGSGVKQLIPLTHGHSCNCKTQRPHGSGVAEEDINCRCTIAPVIEGEKVVTDRVGYWKLMDEKAERYEDDMKNSYIIAFDNQEEIVLEALQEVGG